MIPRSFFSRPAASLLLFCLLNGGEWMSLTTIRLREAWNLGGLSIRQLALRTYAEIDRHETIDRAAIVAFYAMLSLVPLLSFLLAIAFGVRQDIATELLAVAHQWLPAEAHGII